MRNLSERKHTSVEVHGHVGQVELDKGVVDALQVGTLSVSALGHVQVGNQVSETVRLW